MGKLAEVMQAELLRISGTLPHRLVCNAPQIDEAVFFYPIRVIVVSKPVQGRVLEEIRIEHRDRRRLL